MKIKEWTLADGIKFHLWQLEARMKYWLTGWCGLGCGYQEPYGFVPEADCPIHDVRM